MRLAESKGHEIHLGRCINALLGLMDIVLEDFVSTGYLRTMQDLIIVAIASAAVRLGHCLSSVQTEVRSLIRGKLNQGKMLIYLKHEFLRILICVLHKTVKVVCNEAAQGDTSSTAAYLSRFIARLLGKLSSGSVPFSRRSSPAPLGVNPADMLAGQEHPTAESLLADLVSWLHRSYKPSDRLISGFLLRITTWPKLVTRLTR